MENRTDGSYEELIEMAQNVDDSVHDYEETCNQLEILNRQMDASFDFAEKRRLLRHYRSEMEKRVWKRRVYRKNFELQKRD